MKVLLKATLLLGLTVAVTAPAPRPAEEWKLVFDRPYQGKYEDISFPDTTNGWVVASQGFILHTADGGATWETQATGMPGLRSVDFIDPWRGFAGALSGKLYGTTDGGVHWNDITGTLPFAARGFCGITHVGIKVHVVGRYNLDAADYFYSPDAGKTWRHQDLRSLAKGLVDVAFVSDSVGFIGGMGKTEQAIGATPPLSQQTADGVIRTPGRGMDGSALILKTTDGGLHWREVFHDRSGPGYAWKIWPISRTLIYASMQSEDGTYRIAKSTDGGEHFEVLTVATGLPIGPAMQGIGFLDANTGWVGGFFAGMWRTVDGGKTWEQLTMTERNINRFERVGNTLITAGTRGVLRLNRTP